MRQDFEARRAAAEARGREEWKRAEYLSPDEIDDLARFTYREEALSLSDQVRYEYLYIKSVGRSDLAEKMLKKVTTLQLGPESTEQDAIALLVALSEFLTSPAVKFENGYYTIDRKTGKVVKEPRYRKQ